MTILKGSSKIDLLTYILVVGFGLSSWISINSVWVELPIFVRYLPEKWALPSFFSIVIQLGNIATILFTAYNFRFSGRKDMSTRGSVDESRDGHVIRCDGNGKESSAPDPSHRAHDTFPTNHERYLIYAVLLLQIFSAAAAIFFWNATSNVAGRERSTSLLILLFFMSLTNCGSSVLFLPYLSHFTSPTYVTAYYVGAGLSGFLPSALSLMQGIGGTPSCHNVTVPNRYSSTMVGSLVSAGNNYTEYDLAYPTTTKLIARTLTPNFGVDIFFSVVCALLVASATSFFVLNRPGIISRHLRKSADVVRRRPGDEDAVDVSLRTPTNSPLPGRDDDTSSPTPVLTDRATSPGDHLAVDVIKSGPELRKLVLMLALLGWISALANGIIPSIQSYATLPFGNKVFHLSISLSSLANPCLCFLASFYPTTRWTHIVWLAVSATTISSFLFTMATMSPKPWLLGTVYGGGLNVVLWILVEGIFSYTKVCLASRFHSQGKRWLLWFGVFTQVGSSLGAFLIFVMINVLKLFKSGQECS